MAAYAKTREQAQEDLELQTHDTETNSPLNKSITIEEVMAANKRIKINKTPGPDSITNRMIKAGGEPLARILHGLFQQLWTWGCTPRSWSRVLVNPIHKGKKKDKLDPSSYRGIALSSALAKTFEIIVDQRLEEDTRIRNICTSKQFGSKRGNSCSDAMHPFLSHIEQERQASRRAAQSTAQLLILKPRSPLLAGPNYITSSAKTE
jgi:hypothetical protein